MNNEISISKIIADIKATKGNRSGCQGLHSSLESDGYITSICKWTRATNPDRIDALVEHVEKQDAALIAWEKSMMEVCGEDGPASVASEIRALRALRDTSMQALRSQVKQLAAENVQIKAMNDCLSEELRGYESDGAFEGPKMHLLWWQVETPATDRIVSAQRSAFVDEAVAKIAESGALTIGDCIVAVCLMRGEAA